MAAKILTDTPVISNEKPKKFMKLIVSFSAITAVVALAVTGCSQGSQGDSTATPITNSSPANASGMGAMNTNTAATNTVPGFNTNTAANTNQ